LRVAVTLASYIGGVVPRVLRAATRSSAPFSFFRWLARSCLLLYRPLCSQPILLLIPVALVSFVD